MRYKNKTCVVTGGTSGIGLATAQRFLTEGANVVIAGSTAAKLERAASALDAGDSLLAVKTDVSQLADLDRLFAKTAERFGQIDAVFANAGVAGGAANDESEEERFDRIVAINFKGIYFTVQKALPHMPDGSAIVLTASLTQYQGLPQSTVYAATKAAVSHLARSMTAALLPTRGIRVNAISPGVIETGMTGDVVTGDMRASIEAQTPARRIGRPEEIAVAVAFLCSDEASFIAAEDLLVDGGRIRTNLWTFD